jgi:hypothetical protein
MALTVCAMAGGFAAAEVGEGERARERVFGNSESAQQLKLTLAQSRSEQSVRFVVHATVILPSVHSL